jgi:hypothetical protein
MATLVKIAGLDRAGATADAPILSRGDRGFRIKSALSPIDRGGTAASYTPTATTVTFTAVEAGAWGNNVQVQAATGTLAVSTTFAATTGYPVILVTAPATATLAANKLIVAKVNADPTASQYVVAKIAGAGTSAWAAVSATNLTSGAAGSTTPTTDTALYVYVNNGAIAVVDITDPLVARVLRRNYMRIAYLGQP